MNLFKKKKKGRMEDSAFYDIFQFPPIFAFSGEIVRFLDLVGFFNRLLWGFSPPFFVGVWGGTGRLY